MTLPTAPGAAIVAYLFSLYSINIGNKLAFLCFVSLFCFSCLYYTTCYCFKTFCLHRLGTYTHKLTKHLCQYFKSSQLMNTILSIHHSVILVYSFHVCLYHIIFHIFCIIVQVSSCDNNFIYEMFKTISDLSIHPIIF